MSGYTPLFGSLTTGTLCGRWPDIGLWPIVLSMCDKHGVVDVTPQYIASVTGLSLEEVIACMQRFCIPDPYSRSDAAAGARLVLLDEHRDWGWSVVNHGTYRERARLAAKSAREVENGSNSERLAQTASHRRSPPLTAAERPSNANAYSDKNKKAAEPPGALEPVPGLDEKAWAEWTEYRIGIKKPIKPLSVNLARRQLAAHGAQQLETVHNSIANGYQGLVPPRQGFKPPAKRVTAPRTPEQEAEYRRRMDAANHEASKRFSVPATNVGAKRA
jgi:hypothetical protein